MPRYQVTVTHNTGPGRFIGYMPADTLAWVFELTIDETSPEAACELVYAICNSGPGELHCPPSLARLVGAYRAGGLRSLSVGDVLILREEDGGAGDTPSAWHCIAAGFDQLPSVPSRWPRLTVRLACDRLARTRPTSNLNAGGCYSAYIRTDRDDEVWVVSPVDGECDRPLRPGEYEILAAPTDHAAGLPTSFVPPAAQAVIDRFELAEQPDPTPPPRGGRRALHTTATRLWAGTAIGVDGVDGWLEEVVHHGWRPDPNHGDRPLLAECLRVHDPKRDPVETGRWFLYLRLTYLEGDVYLAFYPSLRAARADAWTFTAD